tara:strand:+ start:1384 stop:1743 length:360 start_codon:yes stop_codon:yes gene_type:complete
MIFFCLILAAASLRLFRVYDDFNSSLFSAAVKTFGRGFASLFFFSLLSFFLGALPFTSGNFFDGRIYFMERLYMPKKVVLTKNALLKEHKSLIQILRHGTVAQRLKEAASQQKEMKKYK